MQCVFLLLHFKEHQAIIPIPLFLSSSRKHRVTPVYFAICHRGHYMQTSKLMFSRFLNSEGFWAHQVVVNSGGFFSQGFLKYFKGSFHHDREIFTDLQQTNYQGFNQFLNNDL